MEARDVGRGPQASIEGGRTIGTSLPVVPHLRMRPQTLTDWRLVPDAAMHVNGESPQLWLAETPFAPALAYLTLDVR